MSPPRPFQYYTPLTAHYVEAFNPAPDQDDSPLKRKHRETMMIRSGPPSRCGDQTDLSAPSDYATSERRTKRSKNEAGLRRISSQPTRVQQLPSEPTHPSSIFNSTRTTTVIEGQSANGDSPYLRPFGRCTNCRLGGLMCIEKGENTKCQACEYWGIQCNRYQGSCHGCRA
jgi:hypothetical protein